MTKARKPSLGAGRTGPPEQPGGDGARGPDDPHGHGLADKYGKQGHRMMEFLRQLKELNNG